MPRVAQATRGLGITDTIGHQETGCEYRLETIKGKTCMERERQRERKRGVEERQYAVLERNILVSTGERHN